MNASLDESQVKRLIESWYQKLDVHAPLEELLTHLAGDELEFELPEGTLRGRQAFSDWYENVVRIFFDEEHELAEVAITPTERGANVELVVNWKARRWRPPAAQSEFLHFDARQRWEVDRAAETGEPVIRRYVVEALTPREGSAEL